MELLTNIEIDEMAVTESVANSQPSQTSDGMLHLLNIETNTDLISRSCRDALQTPQPAT